MSNEEMIRAFAELSPELTEFGVSWEELHDKSEEGLRAAFATLPSSVSKLCFRYSCSSFSQRHLVLVFSTLPASLKTLVLSDNSLSEKTGIELAQAFQAFPVKLKKLDLSYNRLSLHAMEG